MRMFDCENLAGLMRLERKLLFLPPRGFSRVRGSALRLASGYTEASRYVGLISSIGILDAARRPDRLLKGSNNESKSDKTKHY
jgi:hypothetical protein